MKNIISAILMSSMLFSFSCFSSIEDEIQALPLQEGVQFNVDGLENAGHYYKRRSLSDDQYASFFTQANGVLIRPFPQGSTGVGITAVPFSGVITQTSGIELVTTTDIAPAEVAVRVLKSGVYAIVYGAVTDNVGQVGLTLNGILIFGSQISTTGALVTQTIPVIITREDIGKHGALIKLVNSGTTNFNLFQAYPGSNSAFITLIRIADAPKS